MQWIDTLFGKVPVRDDEPTVRDWDWRHVRSASGYGTSIQVEFRGRYVFSLLDRHGALATMICRALNIAKVREFD